VDYVAVLLPSLVVGLLFWFAMKSIFNADKSERQAEARAQADADARAAAGASGPAGPTSAGPAAAGPRPGPATDAPSEPTAESDK
jgi:hypothetical protein